MFLLLAFMHWWIAWHILPLVPFSTVNNILASVNKSLLSFLRQLACYATPVAERKWAAYIEIKWAHIFQDTFSERLLNTSSCNNVSVSTCKSRYSPNYLF